MNKMLINGVEITTNYDPKHRRDYPISNGERKVTMTMIIPGIHETEMEVLERLVKEGYKRVTFYEETTCVRGYHKVFAFAK